VTIRRISIGVLLLALAAAMPAACADVDPLVVLFHEDGCLSCEDMLALLEGLVIDDFDARVAQYEIVDPESARLLSDLSKAYAIDVPQTVPIVFVNDQVFVGTLSFSEERLLSDTISDCLREGCESPMARLPQVQLRRDLPRVALFLAAFLALAWLQLR